MRRGHDPSGAVRYSHGGDGDWRHMFDSPCLLDDCLLDELQLFQSVKISCPKCGTKIELGPRDINSIRKCSCGYCYLSDANGHVMEWAAWNTIDYSPVPTDIRKFLTAAEIENRQRVHRTAFDEICYGSEYVESASVSRMLEIRAARICDKLRSSSKTSSGCLAMLVALAGVVCYTFWADKNWLIPFAITLFLAFMGSEPLLKFREEKKKVVEDGKRLRGRLAMFYASEAERLKDNINAKWRYEKRVAEQEEERRRVEARAAEIKAQEEARRAEIQRLKDESLKNDEAMVVAIRKGVVPFDCYVASLESGDGHGYEDRVMDFANRCGFECKRVSNSADHGVDLELKSPDGTIAIQCKFKSVTVGNDAVQEVFTGKHYYKYDEAWVVSNCQFTKRAREEAKRLRVKLVQTTICSRFSIGWTVLIL